MIGRKVADLENAAISWWVQRRPRGWDKQKHLENPIVNVSGESEKKLAQAVASLLRKKGSESKRFG